MTKQQEIFLQEYLATEDKIAAYRKAYPKAKESSLKNSANRLMQNNPEIITAIQALRCEHWQEADARAAEDINIKCLTKLRAKQLLTLTAEGTRDLEKVWRTRDGFVTHDVKPGHAQALSAIHKYAMLEGWYAKARVVTVKKEKEEQKNEPVKFKISIGGLPIEEYEKIHRATLDAYFDEDANWRSQPDNNHTAERFAAHQKQREERRDDEREARMTPQLRLEEEQAIKELQVRPVDETAYHDHEKIIEKLYDEYRETKEPAKLEALSSLQKMCGLRFLHHRHRYEAERAAGWEFHPLNHALIRQTPSGSPQGGSEKTCHSDSARAGTEPARSMQVAQSTGTGSVQSAIGQTRVTTDLRFRQEDQQSHTGGTGNRQQNRQQTTTVEEPAVLQPPPKPTPLQMRQRGYTPLNELHQDEYDYYLKNQGSTTYRQLNELKRFISHRNATPELRKQIEQETGWLFHPDDTGYAKRQPGRPLVRTKFPGPLRSP